MPRKRLLPRNYRQRSPPRGHRHHPLTPDHSFLANFNYFALTESYTLAALDALHARILAHDFVSALHLLLLVVRARSPPPFLTVWQAGVAILRGLLLARSPSATPGATPAAVTPMSIVRLLMTMLAMDESMAVYRPQLAVEIALALVSSGEVAQAYTHLDPLAAQYPYADDLHVVGVLGMVCVALIEKNLPPHDELDDQKEEEEEEEEREERPRYLSQSSSRLTHSQLPSVTGPYVASARVAFDRLLAVHPATPSYLEYHLRYLALAGLTDQIPGVIERVLGALACVANVSDPRSVEAAELCRRREHVWALANSYGVEPRAAPNPRTTKGKVGTVDPPANNAIADPTLSAPWYSCPPPRISPLALSPLLDVFDYPVHSLDQWRQLVCSLYRLRNAPRVAALFDGRKAWWFALHLTNHAADSVQVLVYKLVVMRLVVPDMLAASKDAVWMARRVQLGEQDASVRPVVEGLVGELRDDGHGIKVEDVYVAKVEREDEVEDELQRR